MPLSHHSGRQAGPRDAETALRHNQRYLRQILEAFPEIVWIADSDGEVTFVNGRWSEVTGRSPGEGLGWNWTSALHPDDAERLLESWRGALATGEPLEAEYRVRCRDGRWRWHHSRAVPLEAPSGEVEKWFGTAADIDERKRAGEARSDLAERLEARRAEARQLPAAEQALRASELRYRTLFESIDEGFCVFEMLFDDAGRPCDYRFLEVNPAFEKQTGITGAVGRRMREIAPDHEEHWFEIYGHVAETGEPVRFENSARALGRFFDVYAFRVGEPGQRRVAVLFNDITQRKRAEDALRASEVRLAGELDAMTRLHELVARLLDCPDLPTALDEVLLATIDLTGAEMGVVQLLDPREGALKIVAQRGFRQDFLDYFRAVKGDDPSACGRVMASGERVVVEDVWADPLFAPHRGMFESAGCRAVQSTPLLCRNGELLGVLSTHYSRPYRPSPRDLRLLDLYARQAADVIEHMRAEDTLRAMNEQLERRVLERTAELQRQNQRLRRLAEQLTKAEQRERRKLAQTLHDGLQQILVAGKIQWSLCGGGAAGALDRLGELLDAAIDTSRSLSYELSPRVLHEAGLAEAVAWLGRWFQNNHDFEVRLHTDDAFPDVVGHLRTFLFHAVRELLLNAVKYSGRKEAAVRLSIPQPGQGRVTVADQGRGFDPQELDSGDDELHGLGLFSIRERLAALGGTLAIDAAPGAGARFDMTVPLEEDRRSPPPTSAPAATSSPAVPAADAPGPVRLLIVDDHGIVREGLISLLEGRESIELVGEACDGVEAVELAADLRPDVVLMDVNMPRMNGIEATRRIKAGHPEITVIGLSFHEEQDLAEAMRRAGASAYLPKGGDAETLFNTIHQLRPAPSPR